MDKLHFDDGVTLDTGGEYRVEKKKDGWYVLGHGSSLPVDSRQEGEELIETLTKTLRKN